MPDFLDFVGAKNKNEMAINDIAQLAPLRLPPDTWRDHKKLTKYLTDVEKTVNNMVRGVKEMMDKFSDELMARPTYAETYFNFRLNV